MPGFVTLNSSENTVMPRLRAVPDTNTPEFTAFVEDSRNDGPPVRDEDWLDGWERLDHEEALLSAGLPVVSLVAQLPEVADEAADVHEAAVSNLAVARLKRHIGNLPPEERLAIRMWFGIGRPRHGVAELATRLGRTPSEAADVVRRGVARLRAGLDATRAAT